MFDFGRHKAVLHEEQAIQLAMGEKRIRLGELARNKGHPCERGQSFGLLGRLISGQSEDVEARFRLIELDEGL